MEEGVTHAHDALTGWVEAEIIGPAEAVLILDSEQRASERMDIARPRTEVAVLVGLVVAHLAVARWSFTGGGPAVAVALATASFVVGHGLWERGLRLGAVVLGAGALDVTWAVAVAVVDRDLRPSDIVFGGAVTIFVATAWWARTGQTAQQVGVWFGLLAAALALAAVTPGVATSVGAVAVGAVWLALTSAKMVRPRSTGTVLATLAAGGGLLALSWSNRVAAVAGLVVLAAALLAVGRRLREQVAVIAAVLVGGMAFTRALSPPRMLLAEAVAFAGLTVLIFVLQQVAHDRDEADRVATWLPLPAARGPEVFAGTVGRWVDDGAITAAQGSAICRYEQHGALVFRDGGAVGEVLLAGVTAVLALVVAGISVASTPGNTVVAMVAAVGVLSLAIEVLRRHARLGAVGTAHLRTVAIVTAPLAVHTFLVGSGGTVMTAAAITAFLSAIAGTAGIATWRGHVREAPTHLTVPEPSLRH